MLAFIMIPILQRELDDFKNMWNAHKIRHQVQTLVVDDIPNHIYDFPERHGLQQCGKFL